MIASPEPQRVDPRVRLRLTEAQHAAIYRHLFPGDGYEAVAILLCGRAGTNDDEVLVVHEVLAIPYEECERTPFRLKWHTDRLHALLPRAVRSDLGIVKIHSHPGGWLDFSEWDDASDRDLFPSIHGWMDNERPHLSAVMVPDGAIRARGVTSGRSFYPVTAVTAIGKSIREWRDENGLTDTIEREHSIRTAQVFGAETTRRLSRLSIGVVGCSGTGSWVVELLARMGVAEIVLVDPDKVEHLNLNRILHATVEDARASRAKVQVLAEAVTSIGTGVRVESYVADVLSARIVKRLSRCDVVMGCVDSIDARDLMCRLSSYYVLPYVDVGVRLVADGTGGIAHIAGTAHYVHPESPSLMDRGVYTAKQLADAGLRRTDPTAYAEQVKARYISNANEARPAVASVNAFYASLAINELLARLHSYRDPEPPLGVTISLSQLRFVFPEESPPSPGLAKRIGRGDSTPLLGLPALSE